MPSPRLRAFIRGSPEQVFEYVTGFAAAGRPDRRALEERYGRLVERQGNTYTFQEKDNQFGEPGPRWRCTFEPPRRRLMRVEGSTWSDRTDEFQASENGTRWTITWEPKVQGLPVYTQWLAFQLRSRRRIHRSIVLPVQQHFSPAGGGH